MTIGKIVGRPVEVDPIEWEAFNLEFWYRFFPWELMEAKIEEFINLKKGNMSVKEYALKTTFFSKKFLFFCIKSKVYDD